MKFLLVAPPKEGMQYLHGHPPVGLGYLATALQKLGHTVEIQDCIINEWSEEDLFEYIKQSEPGVVGITVFSAALSNVAKLTSMIKRDFPKILTIVGGPHPTASVEHTLKFLEDVDFAIQGEGEIPLKELDAMLGGKKCAEDVPGLVWRKNGIVKYNDVIQYDHIEDFGFPAWDLIEPPRYFKCAVISDKAGVIYTTRGCPFGCKFCVKHGRKLRHRPLDHIWEEITFLNKKYGITRFHLGDEGFPINVKFVKDFCRYVIAKKVKYRFEAARGLRLDVLDNEMLELMNKAGFGKYFAVGIESAVPRVRKLMNKHLTQEQLNRGLILLNKHGFRPDGNFILGYPGETREEMLQTVDWAVKSKFLWGAAFTPFIPLPGSEAVNELIKNKEISEDFDFSQLGTDRVLYAPQGMTTEELDNIRKQAVWRFNFRPRIIKRYITCKRIGWAGIRFVRIFLPSKFLPKKWRR